MPIAIGAALHLRCTDALSTDPQNTRAQAAVRATTQAVCAESRVSRSALALITNGSLNGGAQALADLVCRLSDEADRATPAASAAHAHVRSGRAPDHAHNRDPSHADQRDPARGRAGRAFGARAWSARDLTGRSAAAMAPCRCVCSPTARPWTERRAARSCRRRRVLHRRGGVAALRAARRSRARAGTPIATAKYGSALRGAADGRRWSRGYPAPLRAACMELVRR